MKVLQVVKKCAIADITTQIIHSPINSQSTHWRNTKGIKEGKSYSESATTLSPSPLGSVGVSLLFAHLEYMWYDVLEVVITFSLKLFFKSAHSSFLCLVLKSVHRHIRLAMLNHWIREYRTLTKSALGGLYTFIYERVPMLVVCTYELLVSIFHFP